MLDADRNAEEVSHDIVDMAEDTLEGRPPKRRWEKMMEQNRREKRDKQQDEPPRGLFLGGSGLASSPPQKTYARPSFTSCTSRGLPQARSGTSLTKRAR